MKVKTVILIVSILFLVACRKGFDRPEWDVNAYIPLVSSTLDLRKSFGDSLVQSGADNKLKLVYKGNLFSLKLDSIFKIPDTTTTNTFSIPIGNINLVPNQPIVSDTNKTELSLNAIQLKKAILRQGEIKVKIQSSVAEKTIFTYSLPAAKKNGVPLSATFYLAAGSKSAPSVQTRTFDMKGYELDLTGLDSKSYNKLDILYAAKVDPTGNNVTLTAGDFITFSNSFVGVVPEYGQGYFGSETKSENKKDSGFDLFKNLSGSQFNINKAQLVFEIKNQVGVDISAKIHQLKGSSSTSGKSTTLNHSLIGKKINLSRATIDVSHGYPPIKPFSKKEIISDANSNVTQFVSDLPDELEYNIEFTTNPVGNASNGFDFIYYNTGIELNLDAEIPLSLSAKGLTLKDTNDFSIDFDSKTQAKKINGGQLLLRAWNGYPLEAYLQFYLLDQSQNVIDSLFTNEHLLPSGKLNSNKIVSDKSYSTAPIPLTKERIDRLYETKFIKVQARMNTTNYPDTLQLYDYYNIDLKLIGDFNYAIDPQSF